MVTVLCFSNALVWAGLTLFLVSVVGPHVSPSYKRAVGPVCTTIMLSVMMIILMKGGF